MVFHHEWGKPVAVICSQCICRTCLVILPLSWNLCFSIVVSVRPGTSRNRGEPIPQDNLTHTHMRMYVRTGNTIGRIRCTPHGYMNIPRHMPETKWILRFSKGVLTTAGAQVHKRRHLLYKLKDRRISEGECTWGCPQKRYLAASLGFLGMGCAMQVCQQAQKHFSS